MRGEGDTIRCLACGNGARVNADYSLTPLDETCVLPKTPKQWFDEERKHVYHALLNPAFSLVERVRLGVLPQDKPLKNLIFAIVINGGIVAVELVFGLLINHATLQILPVSDGAMAHCNHCN